MKIDGKLLAQEILETVASRVKEMSSKGIYPHLAVVFVGKDLNSLVYISQKQKNAHNVGVRFTLDHSETLPGTDVLIKKLHQYNHDPQVHGLILQRPLPSPYSFKDLIRQTVSPKKDVDGFLPASPFTAPVARAVLKILNKIYFTHVKGTVKPDSDTSVEFLDWFSQKRIVLLGKGETAGAPIAQTLSKFGILYEMVTSTTQNPEKYLGSGEVIISSIGKPDAVNFKVVRKEAILIGVGLASIDGKLVGDYDNSWAEQNTAFYTPTPGGVGPVNVACLMQNVCDGASSQFRLSI